jgi:hypothetical protein
MGDYEKVIPGYETYSVTRDGFVRDLRTHKLKTGHNHLGYRMVNLHNKDGIKNIFIHRLVAMAFISNPDNLPEVDHIDRNPINNSLENLRWANDFTQSQNRGDQKNNITGYKNITAEDNFFRVVITRNGKMVCRKRFAVLEDAVKYRDSVYSTL